MSKVDLLLALAAANILLAVVRVYQGHAQNKLAKRKLDAWRDD